MKQSLPFQYVMISAALCSVSLPARASEDEQKPFEADLVVEWQNEFRDSDDTTIDGTNNSFLRAELAPTIRLSDNVFIDGVLVFEPMDQAATLNADDSIWFDREGAFAEELKINAVYGPYAFWAGKFNPGFGMAWDYGRGIWSEDFAEDYEITEKLGFGTSYTLETEGMGTHTLSATTFFNDISALSGSIITARDKTRLRDGGAGNTGDFSSYTVSFDGENLAGIENLGYHLGYRFLGEQDKNRDNTTDDESGFVATLKYTVPVNPDLSFDMLGEYVTLNSFEGVHNSDRDYYSSSVITRIYGNWNVTMGYTLRDIKNDGTGTGSDDHLFQLSGGYDFGNGLTTEIGWRSSEESNVHTDIVGFLFRYAGDIL